VVIAEQVFGPRSANIRERKFRRDFDSRLREVERLSIVSIGSGRFTLFTKARGFAKTGSIVSPVDRSPCDSGQEHQQ
jgi:hypothetical protein